ncbi:cystatin-1-like [Engystomops pustulosus]|uniref:cystatin-1-like n=1 Tax=Engystomops pustulosus TaxID=76066 RepID=UPI003AFAEE60
MKLFVLFFTLITFCYCAVEEELIVPEVAHITGGWKALPLNSRKVINMVMLLQNTYNKNSNSLYWSKFTKVEEASVQVTNGISYRFTVIVEPTGCLKEEDFKNCKTPGFDDMPVEKCHYVLREMAPKFKPVIIGKACEQM